MPLALQRQPNPRNRMKGLADLDMGGQKMHMPADGFTMNAALRYLPYRSFPLQLGQLDELRVCADHYRARWITLPLDLRIPIEAGDTFVSTQRIAQGSILYGMNFSTITEGGTTANFDILVTELCSEEGWFDDPIVSTALRPTPAAAQGTDLFPVLFEPWCLWGNPQPQLSIQITNKSNQDQQCQLMLHLAEPCGAQGGGTGPFATLPWSQGGVL